MRNNTQLNSFIRTLIMAELVDSKTSLCAGQGAVVNFGSQFDDFTFDRPCLLK